MGSLRKHKRVYSNLDSYQKGFHPVELDGTDRMEFGAPPYSKDGWEASHNSSYNIIDKLDFYYPYDFWIEHDNWDFRNVERI